MENLININLEYSTAPQIQEARGKNWIEYGTDDYKNLYPQFIIDLYYNSGTHSAIINATAQMIAGQDITAKETDSVELNAKLENFFKNVNSKETLHEVIKKCAFDFSKVLQSSRETIRVSNDKLLFIAKWIGETPVFLNDVDTYTHAEILIALQDDNWTTTE